MLPTVAKPNKREKNVADHQQRLLKSDKQLSMHGDQSTDVEQESTCSASIKTCLNLPAERKEEEGVSVFGVGRGGEYETPNSTRGNQGNVPVARGFVTVVLRQLSIDSLALAPTTTVPGRKVTLAYMGFMACTVAGEPRLRKLPDPPGKGGPRPSRLPGVIDCCDPILSGP
jgi:hypothetical protein